jgi:hypothetical protein
MNQVLDCKQGSYSRNNCVLKKDAMLQVCQAIMNWVVVEHGGEVAQLLSKGTSRHRVRWLPYKNLA